MSRVCQVTGKKPMYGNNVSHSHIKTHMRQLPNIQKRRFWVEAEQRRKGDEISCCSRARRAHNGKKAFGCFSECLKVRCRLMT